MGTFTVTKRIANQGHTLAINITKECHTFNIQKGEIVTVTIEHISIPNTETNVSENHD